MEWLRDRFGALNRKLWLSEAARALGTTALAKGRVVFHNKSVSWKSLRGAA